MKPKADLKLVILCLSTPVYFLEVQANVELVLRIMQSTMVYNPMGSTKLCREGKGEQESISFIPNHCSGIKQEVDRVPQ